MQSPDLVTASSRHVLIVDDDDDIREVATLSLEMTEGWRITVSSSGVPVPEVVRTAPPDAILLDVMMPDMDGPTVVRQLRADPATRGIPVIFLTAKVQEGDRRRFLELGVRGIIAKPFDPMTLGAQIRELLGWT